MKVKREGSLILFVALAAAAFPAAAAQPPDVVNSDSNFNTAMGTSALLRLTSGVHNTAAGADTEPSTSTGSDNTALGFDALFLNTSGSYNTAIGNSTLSQYNGNYNTAVGYKAMGTGAKSSTIGYNVAVGAIALQNNNGNTNVAIGYGSLYSNTTGSYNTAIGPDAGSALTTGNNNIDVANAGVAGESDVIRIGVQGAQTQTFVAGISGTTVSGVGVVVSSTGQLGVASSSRRYKQDIQPIGVASERIYDLRPVSFRYRAADERGAKPRQFGLVAEEVARVMPELVAYNTKGEPEAVAYQTLPSLLLNELQKEHQRNAQQAARLSAQAVRIAALEARLEELSLRLGRLATRDAERPAGGATAAR